MVKSRKIKELIKELKLYRDFLLTYKMLEKLESKKKY